MPLGLLPSSGHLADRRSQRFRGVDTDDTDDTDTEELDDGSALSLPAPPRSKKQKKCFATPGCAPDEVTTTTTTTMTTTEPLVVGLWCSFGHTGAATPGSPVSATPFGATPFDNPGTPPMINNHDDHLCLIPPPQHREDALGAAGAASADDDSAEEVLARMESLPGRVWAHVLSFVDMPDLLSLSGTCSLLHRVARMPCVWRSACMAAFGRVFTPDSRRGLAPLPGTTTKTTTNNPGGGVAGLTSAVEALLGGGTSAVLPEPDWMRAYFRLEVLLRSEGTRVAAADDAGDDDHSRLCAVPSTVVTCPVCLSRLAPTADGMFSCPLDGFRLWYVACTDCARVPTVSAPPRGCSAPGCQKWPLCDGDCSSFCAVCEQTYCASCLPDGGAFPCRLCARTSGVFGGAAEDMISSTGMLVSRSNSFAGIDSSSIMPRKQIGHKRAASEIFDGSEVALYVSSSESESESSSDYEDDGVDFRDGSEFSDVLLVSSPGATLDVDEGDDHRAHDDFLVDPAPPFSADVEVLLSSSLDDVSFLLGEQ